MRTTHIVEYYKGKKGWFIRIKAKNGKIVMDGGESYASKTNAKRAVHRFVNAFKKETVIIAE
jgi:uncharacterized protein YegP (UPF0339 family)